MSAEYVPLFTVLEHTESMPNATPPLDRSLAASMLATAYDEAVLGLNEGGIPIGAALYLRDGTLLGSGHNRRVQENDASVHAETDAFRKAGRRRDYPSCVMVTTLSPCWYCSGLVRQFNIGAVVIGESENFHGGHDWLEELGVEIVLLNDEACTQLLGTFIHEHADLWDEDIGL
jgi:cytosine deaminase